MEQDMSMTIDKIHTNICEELTEATLADDIERTRVLCSILDDVENLRKELRNIAIIEDGKAWDDKEDTGGLVRKILGEEKQG